MFEHRGLLWFTGFATLHSRQKGNQGVGGSSPGSFKKNSDFTTGTWKTSENLKKNGNLFVIFEVHGGFSIFLHGVVGMFLRVGVI